MRITRSMMVSNMLYWTAKQTEKLHDAQTVVASGKQINKPSDNPVVAGQIMKDRATIAAYEQYESNIEQADTWIETSNTMLDSVNTLLQNAQDVISSLPSGDESTREDYAAELQSIYAQIISLANSRYGSSYMYSGDKSNTAPFSNSVDVSSCASSDIVFDLAGVASDLTIEIADSTGTIVRSLTIAGGTAGTNTLTWDGCDDEGNALSGGHYSFVVSATDEEGNAVAAFPSYRGDEGGKKIIAGENNIAVLDNNGGNIFSDALCTLSRAIISLENNADLPSDLSASLETTADRITCEQVTLSNIKSQLENSNDHFTQLVSYISGRVSDLETGSTAQAVVELEAQETDYEATLKAVADVLKMPKLADYLS